VQLVAPSLFAKVLPKVKATEIAQTTSLQKRDTPRGNFLTEQKKMVSVTGGKAESES
jgi:hypothetical protein